MQVEPCTFWHARRRSGLAPSINAAVTLQKPIEAVENWLNIVKCLSIFPSVSGPVSISSNLTLAAWRQRLYFPHEEARYEKSLHNLNGRLGRVEVRS